MTLDVKEVTLGPSSVQFREADEAECWAGGWAPEQALANSIAWSLHAFEVKIEGETIAWWGYAPASVLGSTCIAWMLTTPAADDHPTALGRASVRLFRDLRALYPTILVNVDPNHDLAIKWLTWLGFHYHTSFPGYDQMINQRRPQWVN